MVKNFDKIKDTLKEIHEWMFLKTALSESDFYKYYTNIFSYNESKTYQSMWEKSNTNNTIIEEWPPNRWNREWIEARRREYARTHSKLSVRVKAKRDREKEEETFKKEYPAFWETK